MDYETDTDTERAGPWLKGVHRRILVGLLTVPAPAQALAGLIPSEFDPDRGWRLHPQVAVRPEPLQRCSITSAPVSCRISENNRTILAVVQTLLDYRYRSACRGAGVDDCDQDPYLHA